MLDWHSCQIFYPLEIKVLLLLILHAEKAGKNIKSPASMSVLTTWWS